MTTQHNLCIHACDRSQQCLANNAGRALQKRSLKVVRPKRLRSKPTCCEIYRALSLMLVHYDDAH